MGHPSDDIEYKIKMHRCGALEQPFRSTASEEFLERRNFFNIQCVRITSGWPISHKGRGETLIFLPRIGGR